MIVLAILLDGFYAACHPGGGPLVVHRKVRTLDANAEARARGVATGMPLAEARTILAADGRIVEWQEETYREAQRRWLETVCDYGDVVEPLAQHEALVDLSGHPRPREAAERLRKDLANLGANPSLGLALADPRSYVADVPVASLPVAPEVARSLELLGYRTAADVATLKGETLRAQFSDAAHPIAQAAVGRGDGAVRPLFPEGCVAARCAFDGPPETRQELEAGLAQLAREIGKALRDQDLAGRKVELFLEREDGAAVKASRIFARTLAREEDVANALGLLLACDPEARIVSVRARLPELRSTRRVQLDLQGGRSRSDQAEGVRVALAHVRDAFGDGSVRLVADIKVSRRTRVRRAYRELNGHVWG